MSRHLLKEDMQITNKHMKRCSSSVIIREMQIRYTVRDHLTFIRMASIKKKKKRRRKRIEPLLAKMWRSWNPCVLWWEYIVAVEISITIPKKN